jgi:hypothetical protein
MSDARIAAIARRQHALITNAQAREAIPKRELKRMLDERRLEPVRRGVYRVAGSPESWEQQLAASCLARTGSFASFRAAAALWSLAGFDCDTLEITVPAGQRARLAGVIVHQSEYLGDGHTATRSRIPVTSVARTLCDLSALPTLVSPSLIERALDDAIRRKLLSVRAYKRIAEELASPGRRRATVTRDIWERRTNGWQPGDSQPEVRIAELLVAAGLPRPVQQHRIRIAHRTVRVDLAYPDEMIVIEYDSWQFHGARTAFDLDRARANELELVGQCVLRFTSASSDREIVDTVSDAYRAALAQQTAIVSSVASSVASST